MTAMQLTAFAGFRPAYLRRAIVSTLSLSMLLSFTCSLSVQHGHADVPIAESADQVRPLQSGDAAPRFSVREVDGNRFDFDPAALERPALIITFRGGWCPHCNVYLSDLRHVMPDLRSLDLDVLFLSGDRPALLYESLKDQTREEIDGLGYRILSDADAHAAIALGIAFRAGSGTVDRLRARGRDVDDSSLSRHGVLPVPAVFAVDADGVIRYAFANADYRVRLPADELLDVAQRLAGS